jgi:hypothetical protein
VAGDARFFLDDGDAELGCAQGEGASDRDPGDAAADDDDVVRGA